MTVSARTAAYNTLDLVLRDGAYTGLALKKNIPAELSDADRRFTTRLVKTVLENLLYIDYTLDVLITSKRVHACVRNVLRLGACQMLFMQTAEFAAINESVKLIKKIKPQMSSFVNGVLRNLQRRKDSIEYPAGKSVHALSIRYSYPEWMCSKFIEDFGIELAEALLSYKSPEGTFLRDNTLIKGSLEDELNKMSLRYEKGDIKDSYMVYGLTSIEDTDIYKKGKIAVQSKSAMKAVLSADVKPGSKLLDCCAAPGGKSVYAAALTDNEISILAWDVHEHRIEMTKKNYARLGVKNARVAKHDATVPEPCLKESFDVVLIDAPCSSMGLMAKNPDIRYSRTMKDILSLSKLQKDIINVSSMYVKKGGTLAYFTCSINKEENELVTESFLDRNKNFEYKKQPVTLYPHIEDSDGFYIAIMRRKND